MAANNATQTQKISLLQKPPTKANYTLSGKTILLYGPPGSGKSTAAHRLNGGTYFANFEGGLSMIDDVNQHPCTTWEDVVQIRDEFISTTHRFKYLAIDTADLFYKACEKYIIKINKAKDLNDGELSYGKGAGKVKDEINNFLLSLKHKGFGVILITHGKEREMSTKTSKWTYMGTTLSPSVETVITALSDFIFLCYKNEEKKHVVRTTLDKYILGKDRSSKLPEIMPLDLNLIEETLLQQPKEGEKK